MGTEKAKMRVSFFLVLLAAQAFGASNLRQPATGFEAGFDSKGFLVGGRRVLLRCGGVHYFRIQREAWPEVLRQSRLAGLNMVETPVPWSLHEPARGRFRFDGQADLAAFLDLVGKNRLLAFVRIGPYVNAALSNGGLPAWLGEDKRLAVRSSNGRFIKAVRDYWARLLPVVAARQVPRGPVALVQIEDHYRGSDYGYLPKLYEEAKVRGIKVPVVLSELNPCRDFKQCAPSDTTPFLTTELMPQGPLHWGERCVPYRDFGQVLLEGVARGVDGWNHAMWAGGANLAVLPAASFPTRFEDGTCGMRQDLAPTEPFHQAKQVNWFVEAFETMLTAATSLRKHPVLDSARQAGLVACGRTDGTTSLLFLKRAYGKGDFPIADATTGQSAALPLDAVAMRHVVFNFPLDTRTTLAFSTAQIFAIRKFPDRWLIVAYAPLGSEPLMVFKTKNKPTNLLGHGWQWQEARKQLVLGWRCETKGQRENFAAAGKPTIQVVALEESQLPLTWVLEGLGVVVGLPWVGEWGPDHLEARLPTRRVNYKVSLYPAGNKRAAEAEKGVGEVRAEPEAHRLDFAVALETIEPITIFLRKWEMALPPEAAEGFADGAWTESPRPKPLGEAPCGWYRCTFECERATTGKLRFANVADAATVFLNGRYIGRSATKRSMDAPRNFPHPTSLDVATRRGKNVLAVFAMNWGRYRNTTSYGVPLGEMTAWGILGEVALGERPLLGWRRHEGTAFPTRWRQVASGRSTLVWYRTRFDLKPTNLRLNARLLLKDMGYGAAWLNGKFLGLYSRAGYDGTYGLAIPGGWLKSENELLLLEQDGRQPTELQIRFDRRATYLPLTIRFR